MEPWNLAARFCALITFAMLGLGSEVANALPPARGSNCNSNWVNNGAAMDCFVQGEEETRKGVAHPHYVACTAAGEIFCCVDDNQGNQNCEVCSASRRPPSEGAKLNAILDAQMIMMSNMNKLSSRVDALESRVGGTNRSTAP